MCAVLRNGIHNTASLFAIASNCSNDIRNLKTIVCRRSTQNQQAETEQVQVNTTGQSAGVDDLLDEIDSVLESNAEEFVRGFVQKGGQ